MTVEGHERAPLRPNFLLLTVLVSLVALCWIIGNPRSSGPDEPSHMVTSAGFVRFDTGTTSTVDPALRLVEVPQMVGAPDPVCWALQPTATAGCADGIELTDTTVAAATTSYNYPPWALILPGLASFVAWPEGYAYLARALSSLIPIVLVAAALAQLSTRARIWGVAALVGLTPIAWFTFGTVNPSSMAIAGGLALFAGILLPPARAADLLLAAGWAAVVLPRRDGPVWGAAVVILACALLRERPSTRWRALTPWLRYAVLAVMFLPLLPPLLRRDLGFNLALACAGLAVVAYEGLVMLWQRGDRAGRTASVVGTVGAGIAVIVAAVALRPGGADGEVVRLIVTNTGDHLHQLVGVFGWLSAPTPMSAVVLFWAALGGLAAVGLIEFQRATIVATTGLAVVIVVSWLLELGQGSTYGEYWQGRYSMPLFVGLPLVAAWRPDPPGALDRLTPVLGGVVWIVLNMGFFAAQRRWAVGNAGTWYPWRWDTWDAPLHPTFLLVAHAALTAALVVTVMGVVRTPARGHT